MSSQSNPIRRGGNSFAQRQLDLAAEDEIIRIPACDLTEASERFKITLIGRVLHRGGRSVEAMIALLPRSRIWNVEGRARGANLGNGRFRFDFDKEEDLIMVLSKRSCHFNHWIFALERWEPSTSENFPNTIPFSIKITGVPVHFWNDDTFTAIAKALGKKEDIDAKNARIQVSVDADRPLKMEARIEFPNGDFGKVSMTYEGLNRYCFGCKRLSHDIYSCLDLTSEEREKKIKELREANESGPQGPMSHALSGQLENYKGTARNNKRPRSPSGDVYQRSPTRAGIPGQSRGEKRHKESESYWTTKGFSSRDAPPKMMGRRREEREERHTRHQQKPTVWNRLDDRTGGQDMKKQAALNWRPRLNPAELQRGRDPYRPKERHYSHHSQASHQAWRPRVQLTEGKSCSPSRTVTNPKHPRALTPEKAESQQTISGGLQDRSGLGGQGSGVLVVHKNETLEEKLRRLKGKSIMLEDPAGKTPGSTNQRFPQAMLTRDRGTVVIREGGLRTPPSAPRLVSSPFRLRDETEDPSLELANLMNSKQID